MKECLCYGGIDIWKDDAEGRCAYVSRGDLGLERVVVLVPADDVPRGYTGFFKEERRGGRMFGWKRQGG